MAPPRFIAERPFAWLFGIFVFLLALLYLGVSYEIRRLDSTAEPFRHTLIAFYFILAATALGGMTLLVGRARAQIIADLTRTAESFGRGQFHPPAIIPPEPRLAFLAEALNHMARQIEENIADVHAQRDQQHAIFAAMTDGIIALDEYERIMDINPTAATWLGIDVADALGRTLPEIARFPALLELFKKVLETRTPAETDIALPGPPDRMLQVRACNLHPGNSNHSGILFSFQDVTRIRRLERVRKDFVANVSHELRTPVTSIKGYAETIIEGVEKDEAEHFISIILKKADQLIAIIDDLLELSRIEQGEGSGSLTFDLRAIAGPVQAAIAQATSEAERKNKTIHCDIDPSIRAPLNPGLIERAIFNLIINAIRYSEAGKNIWITAGRKDNSVFIACRDEGPGIEAIHLPRLFERFYRVDKARARAVGGTGLGLAIVKHIAVVHGGKVEVKSSPGLGSTFTLYLRA